MDQKKPNLLNYIIMKKGLFIAFLFGFLICINPGIAQKKKEAAKEPEKKEAGLTSSTFGGLSFRSIGPAWASGRISDFAVNPENHSEIYVGEMPRSGRGV